MTVSWISLADETIASWEAQVPTENQLPFARRLLEAGERHEVFRLTVMPLERSDLQKFDYLQFLNERPGSIPFDIGYDQAPRGYRFVGSARICWLEADEQVRSGWISDVGSLLARLRPDVLDWADYYMAHVPPLEIWYTEGAVRLDLQSDLWYPRVIGTFDDAPGAQAPPSVDNRLLAVCHTPRLNAFMVEARAAALDLGGHWELRAADGIGARYVEMTQETGVTV